jgi:hypothetical protein
METPVRPETARQDSYPGSKAAVAAGCTCPVEHNHGGVAAPDRESWWVAADCPLHGHWLAGS